MGRLWRYPLAAPSRQSRLRALRRAVALERDQDVDDAFEPSSRWGVRPLINILVAAWNEAPLIERHLASFARLDALGSTDGDMRLRDGRDVRHCFQMFARRSLDRPRAAIRGREAISALSNHVLLPQPDKSSS